MKHIMPLLNNDTINLEDGSLIELPTYCKKNCYKGKCREYYSTIANSQAGFYTCPFGLSSLVCRNNSKCYIFSGIRIKDVYRKHNHKFDADDIYNPIITKEKALNIAGCSIALEETRNDLLEKKKSLESMEHEIRKLNSQIKENSDSLLNSYADRPENFESLDANEYNTLFERIRTLYVISSMIQSRYTLADFENNPKNLTREEKIDISIYKKFDKCRRVLTNYKKKHIQINFSGECYKCMKAYPSFEMIPLLILENALKYSEKDSTITVHYSPCGISNLYVTITSYGPHCTEDEITHIFEKGFRGSNAQKVITDGHGIGLYFVKKLCEINDISIEASSSSRVKRDQSGRDNSEFNIKLYFNNVFDEER